VISPSTPDDDKPKSDRKDPMKQVRLVAARQKRLPTVIEAYLKGTSVHQIAKEHGITTNRVYADLRYSRKQWRKHNDIAIDLLMHEQLRKLDMVERNAWEQFEKSCKDAVSTEAEKDEKGTVTKRKRKKAGQAGDPSYLAIVLKAVDQRCRMLKIGAYANEQTADLTATLVEVVVENADQVQSMMKYKQYTELLPVPSDS
jgi:transposase-like protein